MKRSFILACLLATTTAWASTEYLRPTADVDSTNAALISAACSGAIYNTTSASNSAVYSGKSGAGPTGAAAGQSVTTSTLHNRYTMRVFSIWQTTSNTYSALTLSGSFMCAIDDNGDNTGGHCGAAYSTDGGSTWTSLYSFTSTTTDGDSQTTYTATITGATLSNVQVGICALAASDIGGAGDAASITTYDIWTSGTYTTGNRSFPGVIRSAFHGHRKKMRLLRTSLAAHGREGKPQKAEAE